MEIDLSVVLALSIAAAACAWPDPGHDPFVGDVVAAVDRYSDIPAGARAELKRRMSLRLYDEIVPITRAGVPGYAGMRDMHFGSGRICSGLIDKSGWRADHVERGLVYCVQEHCVIVPTVCRNVSRIDRLPSSGARAAVLDIGGGFSSDATSDVLPVALLEVPAVRMQSLDLPQQTFSVDKPGVDAPATTREQPMLVFTIPFAAMYNPPALPAAVEAVPEPGLWQLFLLGLALVALAVWRGQRDE